MFFFFSVCLPTVLSRVRRCSYNDCMCSLVWCVPFLSRSAAAVIFDTSLKRSKGYGFVTFARAEAAELALQTPFKEIDGRVTEVRSGYQCVCCLFACHV